MLGTTAMAKACLALRRLVYALTPRAVGVPFAGVRIHHLQPPVVAFAARHYARMRNRSPPAPKKEVESESESESDSSSSDVEELMDPYREDDLESEELDCFVLDFGAGEKEEEKTLEAFMSMYPDSSMAIGDNNSNKPFIPLFEDGLNCPRWELLRESSSSIPYCLEFAGIGILSRKLNLNASSLSRMN